MMRRKSIELAHSSRYFAAVITYTDVREYGAKIISDTQFRLPVHVADAVFLWNRACDKPVLSSIASSHSNATFYPMTKAQYLDEVVRGAYQVDLAEAAEHKLKYQAKRRERKRAYLEWKGRSVST